jgi:Domain of unknown function (DUF4349)
LITITLHVRTTIGRGQQLPLVVEMSQTNTSRRFHAFVAACTVLALSGCEKKTSELGASSSSASPAIARMAAMAPGTQSATRDRTLAYEHAVSVETTTELLPQRLKEVEAACHADRASGCTILEVALHRQQEFPSGHIRMRLAPVGVEPIIALASKGGTVTGRNTRAEDLAEPVADTERQLALLTLHRERLTELMKSKEIKFEQLITVSKELAGVQSQIDSLASQRANLQRRIDAELLTINLALPTHAYAAGSSPVMDALRYFGSDFRNAVGMVIRFLAVLVPWLVIVLPGLFLLRLFWRWIGRKIARGERSEAARSE